MTVAELIEVLRKLPPDKPVAWRDYNCGGYEGYAMAPLTEDDISECKHVIASWGEPYVLIGR